MPPVVPTPPQGDEPQPPVVAPSDNGGKAQEPEAPVDKGYDLKSLPKEAWEAIYQSDRFKQLNEKAKTADTLLKEKQTQEDDLLKEQGKWQDIATKREQEVQTWKSNSINSEIKAFAAKLGAVDLNDVAALADKTGVQVDENGNITGAEEAVKALVENKPHLFSSNNQPPRVGTGTNPGNANNQGIPKFTHSQIKDPAFFKAHEKDIMAAIRAGTVVDDLA
jgi:hypothetical protein